MRTSFITMVLSGLIASSLATPAHWDKRQVGPVCTGGLYPTAQCCAVDVLGVADLDCETPPTFPANNTDFINICGELQKSASCCLLPVAEQGLICQVQNP